MMIDFLICTYSSYRLRGESVVAFNIIFKNKAKLVRREKDAGRGIRSRVIVRNEIILHLTGAIRLRASNIHVESNELLELQQFVLFI